MHKSVGKRKKTCPNKRKERKKKKVVFTKKDKQIRKFGREIEREIRNDKEFMKRIWDPKRNKYLIETKRKKKSGEKSTNFSAVLMFKKIKRDR